MNIELIYATSAIIGIIAAAVGIILGVLTICSKYGYFALKLITIDITNAINRPDVTIYNKNVPHCTYVKIVTKVTKRKDSSEINWDEKFHTNIKNNGFYKGSSLPIGAPITKEYSGLKEISNKMLKEILGGETFLYYKVHDKKIAYKIPRKHLNQRLQDIYNKYWLQNPRIIVQGDEKQKAKSFIETYIKTGPKNCQETFIGISTRAEKKLIGLASFKYANKTPELIFITVEPEFRKKGVGQKLLNQAIKYFREEKATTIKAPFPLDHQTTDLANFLEHNSWKRKESNKQTSWYELKL